MVEGCSHAVSHTPQGVAAASSIDTLLRCEEEIMKAYIFGCKAYDHG